MMRKKKNHQLTVTTKQLRNQTVGDKDLDEKQDLSGDEDTQAKDGEKNDKQRDPQSIETSFGNDLYPNYETPKIVKTNIDVSMWNANPNVKAKNILEKDDDIQQTITTSTINPILNKATPGKSDNTQRRDKETDQT
nr:hypothetical protein [Tanacetum cinerariifolium]GEY05604.1 hypothetical protein [Tanacetum cinerariifolium]